jgi:microcystin-dependent protein
VTKINRASQSGSLGHVDVSQSGFREQIDALSDAIRQLGGNPEIAPGTQTVNDPLSAQYVLYVNPQIGSDAFVSGDYASADDGTQSQKLRRITLQRLECGYTEARPFKTINRAVIEAALISSRDWIDATAGDDLISIVISPGIHTVHNGLGTTSPDPWSASFTPTAAQLQQFNDNTTGGLIIPRGASLVSLDLRKTIVRPDYVPSPTDEASDYSNRSAIFCVTGGGYYFGMTFKDKEGSSTSHHLLDCFQFTSETKLDSFYAKIYSVFDTLGGLSEANTDSRLEEYRITGPQPATADATVDTVASASPYIYNCSIRSTYGLCGIFADGDEAQGFKSMVVAQFTGVSLQRDMDNWEKYASGSWTGVDDYADYIAQDPDNVRMKPSRRSFHVRAINDAIIQEVSVFAIGQGIHHWVENGGELTVTNSNSNFGGCAALAEGYKSAAFDADSDWEVNRLRVATDLSEKTGNIKKIGLGTVASGTANNATTITLEVDLQAGTYDSEIPRKLERDGYSLFENSFLWIENSRSGDYRAPLDAAAWSSTSPNQITVTAVFENEDGTAPGDPVLDDDDNPIGINYPDLAGANVYIRRIQDTRTSAERRYAVLGSNSVATARTPLRDYVLQTNTAASEIDSLISNSELVGVGGSASVTDAAGNDALIELRRLNPSNTWVSGTYYRAGDVVRTGNKHYSCILENSDSAFDVNKWSEAYVHMEEAYNAEDYFKNARPSIVFDNDTDGTVDSTTLGYNFSTVWANDARVRAQYRSATDYRGLHSFLVSLGFSEANAHTILLPKTAANRDRNPATALDSIANPSGAANAWANWSIEFRRPSNIRLFGHAYEWAGYLNYSKSLPAYQRDLGPANKFTYYFTNQDAGRVYGSGFNEEGFLVTPQGIQDLSTGEESSFDSLGSSQPTDEIEFPTFYDSLSVNNHTVNTELSINGTVSGAPTWDGGFGGVLPSLPESSETQKGIVELATQTETQALASNSLAVSPFGLSSALTDLNTEIINAITDRLVPVGTVLHVAGSTAPDGWLIANGDTVPNGNGTVQGITANFANLFTALGTTYGGAGALPDLRGQFIRSWNSGANADGDTSALDTGRVRGSDQDDATAMPNTAFTGATSSAGSHAHTITGGDAGRTGNGISTAFSGNGIGDETPTMNSAGAHTHTVTIAGGDAETRPTNLALLAVIKY